MGAGRTKARSRIKAGSRAKACLLSTGPLSSWRSSRSHVAAHFGAFAANFGEIAALCVSPGKNRRRR